MRKVFSIILKAIAAFFFYTVNILAFVSEPAPGMKLGLMLGCSVPAVAVLAGGLALTRFSNWKRDTGVVLLCSSGFTAFGVFTFACLLMTEEFRKIMRPDAMTFFSDHLTGSMVIAGLAILGYILTKADNPGKPEQVP